jgi:hypothetical protein
MQRRGSALAFAVVLLAVVHASPASTGVAPFSNAERAYIEASGVVDPRLIDAFTVQDRVRVIIVFAADPPSPAPAGVTLARAERWAAVASVGQSIVDSLAVEEFTLTHRYQTINAIAGKITGPAMLRLLDDPRILRVAVDEEAFASRTVAQKRTT